MGRKFLVYHRIREERQNPVLMRRRTLQRGSKTRGQEILNRIVRRKSSKKKSVVGADRDGQGNKREKGVV